MLPSPIFLVCSLFLGLAAGFVNDCSSDDDDFSDFCICKVYFNGCVA